MRHTLVLAALLAFPLAAKAPLADVSLAWKPTQTVTTMGLPAVSLMPFQGKSFTVAPFTDGRKDPALIGENREGEKKGRILAVTTKDNVPEWITSQTRRFVSNLGLPLAEAGASRAILGEVESFFVAEGENYLGDVRIKIQVQKDGKTVWTGLAMGAAKRFGRSYKLDNYQETLSDSLQEAWIGLMKNQEFLNALTQ